MDERYHIGPHEQYPLEWGWETPDTTKVSTTDMPTPRETLLGRRPKEDTDVDIASSHWGDLKCQGYCASGGDSGTTGAYRVEGKILCWKCAVKRLGVENAPGREQSETLEPFILDRK